MGKRINVEDLVGRRKYDLVLANGDRERVEVVARGWEWEEPYAVIRDEQVMDGQGQLTKITGGVLKLFGAHVEECEKPLPTEPGVYRANHAYYLNSKGKWYVMSPTGYFPRSEEDMREVQKKFGIVRLTPEEN